MRFMVGVGLTFDVVYPYYIQGVLKPAEVLRLH
jgi:hypothetical protein